MKFAQNNNPTFSFGINEYTRLFGTWEYILLIFGRNRVSVQGVKSLGGHFACLCQGFEFYEVKKKMLLFFKKKMEILLHIQSFL